MLDLPLFSVDYSPVFWPTFFAVVPSFSAHLSLSSHMILGIVKPTALPVSPAAAAAVLSAAMVFSAHFQVPGVPSHVCDFVQDIASVCTAGLAAFFGPISAVLAAVSAAVFGSLPPQHGVLHAQSYTSTTHDPGKQGSALPEFGFLYWLFLRYFITFDITFDPVKRGITRPMFGFLFWLFRWFSC